MEIIQTQCEEHYLFNGEILDYGNSNNYCLKITMNPDCNQ